MGVVYAAALRTTRMQDVVTAIDAGSGAGKLKIYTAGLAVLLAVLTLADPCGTVSGDVLTFDFDPDISDSSADNTGEAAAAIVTDSDDNTIVSSLTVGTSGTNIILTQTNITAGDTVTVTSGTITHNTSGS